MTSLFLLLGLFLASANAAAQPTQAQIAACTPDALRLCGEHVAAAAVGRTKPMRACMTAHWAQVSRECKEAVR